MSLSPREISAAVARSTQQRAKPLRATTGAALTAGYLRTLKARGAEVGVWEIRGKVFARVMVAGRDARLSGAEWSVLTSVALHLQHLGRSKGMMTIKSLADDAQVEPRTIRNALRTLTACQFISVRYRLSGQLELRLDRRFGPRVTVPGNKSADRSPRRCAPRKKISTNGNSTDVELPLKDECKDSAPATARRESTASSPRPRTATGWVACSICSAEISCGTMVGTGTGNGRSFAHRACYDERGTGPPGHDPPRKRV